MTDTEVLLAAADLIEHNGLHRGGYWPGYPRSYVLGMPCCAAGAIRAISPAAVSSRLARLTRAVRCSVAAWSDSHTQAEVVATLRAVATSEET